MRRLTRFLATLDERIFDAPFAVLSLIAVATALLAAQIPGVRMYSEFADLLPRTHPYIQLHEEIRDTFGGANVVIVGVEVEEGTIFTNETLKLIHDLTQAVDLLPGVNHNLVTSLTHRSSRKLYLNEVGSMNSDPYYLPDSGPLDTDELARLRDDVVASSTIYGPLVSPDLKAALIKAQLNEGGLDYEETFAQLSALRKSATREGVKIHATGQPVLVGWIYTYKAQILQIFLLTAATMIAILILYFRKLYGVLLPLAGVLVSGVWGLGVIGLLGYNLDPLGLVIPFLISARAMSHGIQLVERYYGELENAQDARGAAKEAFDRLFRPGTLGVVSDAIGLALIALGSVPLNIKLAHYASLWALSVVVNVLLTVPLLLSVLPKPADTEIAHRGMRRLLPPLAAALTSKAVARRVLAMSAVLVATGAYFGSWVTVGEAEPGSPILYRDHDYNVSSKAINERFPGSEELYVVAETAAAGGIKEPAVLEALVDFENYMLLDPDVGAAKGIPDLVRQVNRLLHSTDPGFAQIPYDPAYVGGLLFAYLASSPMPGALKEYVDPDERLANLVFFYKDHRGGTIRRAIHMVERWRSELGERVDGLALRLAGGTIGVTAAMNEAAYRTNLIVLPLVFALIFASAMLFYGSVHAGALLLLSMLSATVLTYAYMGAASLGININTVPIIAVGVGVGIDYSIYMMDRIREERIRGGDVRAAVTKAITTTGLAISFTATTLIAGIIMWILLSELRFQADAARLLTAMIVFNAAAAMFFVPCWVVVFEPRFIVEDGEKSGRKVARVADKQGRH